MSSRHYDVVVLGRSLGALGAAALLARRDFRVLLLGQGSPAPSYRFEGRQLRRRAFTLLFGSSPAWRRILHELAQTQTFRRKTRMLDPMFVVLGDGYRMEVPPDAKLFAREIEREFPEVRQVVDEMYSTFAQVNAAADDAFERDLVWPPGNVWERLETGRVSSSLPLIEANDTEQVLGKFPAGHPYRELALLPARFAADLESTSSLPPFALARLHGSWTRGVQALDSGEDELEAFLIDRIEAHGGVCRLDGHAESLVVKRGAVSGVLEDGEEEPTGAGVVVTDLSGEAVADLASGDGITKSARERWPRLTASAGRFVVSLVVDSRAVPEPLGQEAFLVPRRESRFNPRRPVVHLQRLGAPPERNDRNETLLVAEALVPKRGPLTLIEARQAVLGTVIDHLPFVEQHLKVVDSTHDGLPLYDYASGARREIDRIHVSESSPRPEPMPCLWSVEPSGYLGLAGEPVRGPIVGTYLVGKTVLPALGQEGELMAAWSAAKIITKRDRTRQKMRRDMWTKIETG